MFQCLSQRDNPYDIFAGFSEDYDHNPSKTAYASAWSSIISANLDQVIIRIVHVKSWGWASRAGLHARPRVVTDGMEGIAIGNSLFLYPRECFIKGFARQSERKMFISASAPGSPTAE